MLFDKMMIKNKVEIIASDIDRNALEKAKEGIYSAKGIANVPKEMVSAYFFKEDDKFIIKDQIKNMVSFKILNLLEDNYPSDCDLILCRNVMIYFTEDTKEKLYKKFYNALSNGGVFFVGSTEQIIMPYKYGFSNLRNFFYQKVVE